MAYRRRHGMSKSSTFEEDVYYSSSSNVLASDDDGDSSSLAAQAIRASVAHRESSLSSAYRGGSRISYRDKENDALRSKSFSAYGDRLDNNDSKSGFWGVLARKAKAILEDEKASLQFENTSRMRPQNTDNFGQMTYQKSENSRRADNPTLQNGLDKITTSLNRIGDSFEKAFEEGRAKTQDIIQETQKLQIGRKGSGAEENLRPGDINFWQQPGQPKAHETQVKASRDVAMATAAKAKLLLRELKTVKADLAFAKIRCSQLEEENKVLREGREKGRIAADDDMIRLQLETLLAEKARLAHENETVTRENRFLREIIDYHQLTMQDVVYLDEGIEDVSEVSPPYASMSSMLAISPTSPTSPVKVPLSTKTTKMSDFLNLTPLPEEENDFSYTSPLSDSPTDEVQIRGNK